MYRQLGLCDYIVNHFVLALTHYVTWSIYFQGTPQYYIIVVFVNDFLIVVYYSLA